MTTARVKLKGAARRLANRALGVAAVGALCGVAGAYAAPTYYVSTSGNDLNDGLTPATAWATIGKVDTASNAFVPGTTVLMERGDVWQESLVPQSSGVVGNPITYSAYGDAGAAKPMFLGSDVISGFTSLGNSAYVATTSLITGAAYLNHDFLHPAEILAGTTSPVTYVENNADTYYYDTTAGALYVNTGGVAINNATITATRRPNIVNSNGQSNIVFDNLQTNETAELDSGFGFIANGGSNITIQNSDAYRAGKHHFDDYNSTGFVGKNLFAEYSMPDQFSLGGSTAFVTYGDVNGAKNQTAEWDNISATNLADGEAFIAHGSALAKVTVNNLQALGYGVQVGDDVQSGAVTINGGKTGEIRIQGTGTVINGTEVVNASIYLLGASAIVENVLMHGLSPSTDYRGAIVIQGPNNTIRFSTIETDPGRADAAKVVLLFGNDSGTSLYGNIFTGQSAYVNNVSGQPLSLYSNHNLFDFDPAMLVNYNASLTGAQWQALLGYDLASVVGDPMFTDRADNDFSLMPGSPAIGPFTGAFWQTLTIDMLGNPRPTGATISMGAIEYQQTPGVTIQASADSDLGAAGATVTLNGDILQVNGNSFTSTNRPIVLGVNGGVINVVSATNTFTLNGTVSGGAFSKLGLGKLVLAQNYSTTAVTIVSQGILELAGHTNVSGEVFGAGTLQVDAGTTLVADGIAVKVLHISGAVQVRKNGTADGTSVVNELDLEGSAGAWTTGIDITNNHLIVEDVTNHAAMLAQVKNQAAYGQIHAAGIFSSTAGAKQIIAVVDNAVFGQTFIAGTNIDAGSIVAFSTYIGDTNLDGIVDIQDLTAVANHWQRSVTDWSQGDFDGNGSVDIVDLTDVANNWQAGTTSGGGAGTGSGVEFQALFPSLLSAAAVPEPASLMTLVIGVPFFVARKRVGRTK